MLISVFLYVAAINFSPGFSQVGDEQRDKRSDSYVPCDRGWYYFRDKCYKGGGRTLSERLSWDAARSQCNRWGGDLASIESQEEQEFVVAFPQLEMQYFAWIGLNDREKEGDYKWSDGSAFNYTIWNVGEPSGLKDENEDCVQMVMPWENPPGFNVGKWNDGGCSYKLGYICEKKANPRKRSPNPAYCSSGEGGGWKYLTSCYHIVTRKKSWKDAERHCRDKYNGHLLTILDKVENTFLNYILANMSEDVWIGIKIEDQLQQQWTSGWYVSYNFFNEDEFFLDGTCVARKSEEKWTMIACSNQLSFVCEVYEASPPVLKPPPRGSHCPRESYDWRDLGGEYCYHIETTKTVSYYEAIFDCKRRGGDLVSLHSREEAEILRPFVQFKYWTVYIGLVRSLPQEDTFSWTDGSEFNYQNWNPQEPDNLEEKCVEAVTYDIYRLQKMGWRDIKCDEKRAYICSIRKIVSDSSDEEETGSCANFCIGSTSYLFGLLIQCPEAKLMP